MTATLDYSFRNAGLVNDGKAAERDSKFLQLLASRGGPIKLQEFLDAWRNAGESVATFGDTFSRLLKAGKVRLSNKLEVCAT